MTLLITIPDLRHESLRLHFICDVTLLLTADITLLLLRTAVVLYATI